MNTAFEFTVAILLTGTLLFITRYILIGNWIKWTVLIVVYPVSIWILGAVTSNSSTILTVANRMAMLLACVYALIALLGLSKNRKRIIAVAPRLKIGDNGVYSITEPEKKNDKIGRFLNEERLTHFNLLINRFLVEKKPFLQQKYSLRDLANDVGIPVNYVSAFINRYHKMHYSDLINSYRVCHSKEMIMNGEWERKTLEAIAAEAGFNNRNTFTAAFRKETGQSPSEYLKEVKKAYHKNRLASNKAKKMLV